MSRKASWCCKCVGLATFNVAFLITGIVFYNIDGPVSQLQAIRNEVSEWDLGSVVNITLV